MDEDNTKIRDEPPIFRPGDIEEGGVTIPVPTPTGAVPNPWKPPARGGAADPQAPSPNGGNKA